MAQFTYTVFEVEKDSVSDAELMGLLHHVYVEGGFTDPAVAAAVFAGPFVRERGQLLAVREPATQALVGMVIVVPPNSPTRRLAASNEAELHLLAVASEHRKSGIGKMLVLAALQRARAAGYRRMMLWTQPEMLAAQRLYERCGFVRNEALDFERAGRSFRVYEIEL